MDKFEEKVLSTLDKLEEEGRIESKSIELSEDDVKRVFDEILEEYPSLAVKIATMYEELGAYEFEVQLESLAG